MFNLACRDEARGDRWRRCVGPPRAGHFGLRAHVEVTEARNAAARRGRGHRRRPRWAVCVGRPGARGTGRRRRRVDRPMAQGRDDERLAEEVQDLW